MKIDGWKIIREEWEDKLDLCSDYTIEKTGLSREKLYEVLQILSDNDVI